MKNWSKDLPGLPCPWKEDYQDAKRVAGRGDKARYDAAYDKAVRENLLTRFPGGLRWFAIFMKDEQNLRMMRTVYARAIV